MMTMKLLSTSDAECTASLIMAPEWARMPASSFNKDNIVFPATLTRDTFVAVFSKSIVCSMAVTSCKHG